MDKAKQQLLQNLQAQGFDQKILEAFAIVERRDFVLPEYQDLAYQDRALPLEHGQTISQPYTIAFMLQLLEATGAKKILEIGFGSGYVLALLAAPAPQAQIFGVEKIAEFLKSTKQRLARYQNIFLQHTPQGLGWPERAPFDRILVSAAADELPVSLTRQLADPGILVIPIQNSIWQIKKCRKKILQKEFPGFAFVPLID